MKEKVEKAFIEKYGEPPRWIVRAPGRVNLIGEHTDYNDGFVLPMAIQHAIWMALSPLEGERIQLHSLDFDEMAQLNLLDISDKTQGWFEYVKGVAWVLKETGYPLTGWQGVAAGDIPIGAGLSSSAALELATARAFAEASGFRWDPAEMAYLAQRAENEWVGVNCGIMDQMISATGRTGHAIFIDCQSLETKPVPIPEHLSVIVMDTTTRRGLVDSAYNERRKQCEEGARFFGIQSLRDLQIERFQSGSHKLDPTVRRRVKHVISENQRVLATVEALTQGDVAAAGRYFNASHKSLKNDFEVSSDALDTVVAIAQRQEGCYGARMTGAGFGGCAVALVAAPKVNSFAAAVEQWYLTESGREATLYICEAADGAGVVS